VLRRPVETTGVKRTFRAGPSTLSNATPGQKPQRVRDFVQRAGTVAVLGCLQRRGGRVMRRREFIALLGGAAAFRPVFVYAQSARAPTIGVLLTGNPDPEVFLRAFRAALREIGYIEGQNFRLEIRSAEGKSSALPEKAAELVRLKVDVIVASLTPAIQAAKQATGEIPIVMAPAGDPVATGLVASLARPGGNVTGVSAATAEIAGKSLELVRETISSARRVAVLANNADPLAKPFLEQILSGARTIGLDVETTMVRPETQLREVFEAIRNKAADALIVQGSLQQRELFDLAIEHRLPSFSSNRQVASTGGLMTYAANGNEMLRGATGYVDKILKGAKPFDLPVMQPTKFELIINLKTAKALGFAVSPSPCSRVPTR
jgi:putative ABC transport system substrate-binding protein